MRVLIACEFSGVVRDAFASKGHTSYSCDILPSKREDGNHLQIDVWRAIDEFGPWDMMIAHPPCTYLCVSGNRWMKTSKTRHSKMLRAAAFAKALGEVWHIPAICVENPIGRLSTLWRKPDQIIQPWQFGHPEKKATCLWLKGLPLLAPTKIVKGTRCSVHSASPGPSRWKERSRTIEDIAEAMATQWTGTQNANI